MSHSAHVQLHIDDLSFQYDNSACNLDHVSFMLNKGNIGTILGPSGCGKSTLLRLIAGFLPVSSGHITVGDRLLSSPDHHVPPHERRVGIVFQDWALFPHLTVAQNIGFGCHQLPTKQRQQRVKELAALFDVTALCARYPHECSGGQQQRIAMARALAPQPDLLLLDEPFSSLDASLKHKVSDSLRHQLKQLGITTLLVTHDETIAKTFGDINLSGLFSVCELPSD